MNPFQLYLPTRYVFGHGAEHEAGRLAKEAGAHSVLMLYGGGSAERSGLLARVRTNLKDADLKLFELGGVKPNPRMDLAYEGLELVREHKIDFILAVGGGSVIDTAKTIAAAKDYDGDAWDLFTGAYEPTTAMPIGAILTIPAAGSEGSDSAVMNREIDGVVYKRSFGGECVIPRFALMNPELTWTLPANQTAAGVADIFTHVAERYFTNTKGTYLIDQFCEGIWRTLIRYGSIVHQDPTNREAREQIMWAGTVAHNDFVGVGRAQDWASHAIEHELSALYDVAHGAGLATVLPAWMMHVYKHDIPRFVRFATEVFGIENDPFDQERVALRGINALKAFYSSIGLPTSLAELGGREEDIDFLVANVSYDDEGKLGWFVRLDEAAVAEIYQHM